MTARNTCVPPRPRLARVVAVVRTQEPGTPRFTAIGFFIFYITWMFFILVNIFLAILNDAYIAIKERFDAEEVEEGPPPLTIRQRIANLRAWIRQHKLDQRIENLRKQQRQRELGEKRAKRKVEEAKVRTLKAMGIDPVEQARLAGRGDGSALNRTDEL